MNDPLISVIVPVYKVEPYLDRCVESVLDQDYTNFELILVDDGSPDRCGEMCDEWAQKDRRIDVIHKANGGLSSARNRGIDRARGAYITFIDSDDWVTKDYLSYLLSLFSSNPESQVSCCNHYIVRSGQKKVAISQDRALEVFTRQEAFEQLLFHGKVDACAWAKMYKRDVFSSLRYPEGWWFEDTWLIGDVLKATERIVCGNRCCYFYEIRNDSIANGSFKPEHLMFVDAAKKLAEDAISVNPGNKTGGVRRVNHARLSTLRLMEHCDRRYQSIRNQLRRDVLVDARKYINDPRTPRRDRVAVALLEMGLFIYYTGWKLYTRFR